jgi:hypothetical protein
MLLSTKLLTHEPRCMVQNPKNSGAKVFTTLAYASVFGDTHPTTPTCADVWLAQACAFFQSRNTFGFLVAGVSRVHSSTMSHHTVDTTASTFPASVSNVAMTFEPEALRCCVYVMCPTRFVCSC